MVLLDIQKPRKGRAKFQWVEKAARKICLVDPPECRDGLDLISRTLGQHPHLSGIVGYVMTESIALGRQDWVEFFIKHEPENLLVKSLYSGRMEKLRQMASMMSEEKIVKMVKTNVDILLKVKDKIIGDRGIVLFEGLLCDHPWVGKHISEAQQVEIINKLLEMYPSDHKLVVGIKKGMLRHHAHKQENNILNPGRRPKI